MNTEWAHAQSFIGVYEEWVRVVGHFAEPYRHLLTFLGGPGWSCTPEPALGWLSEIARTTLDLAALWEEEDNGRHTVHPLQGVWEAHESTIRLHPVSLARFSELVDRLVAAGDAVAAVLQRALERGRRQWPDRAW